MGKPERPTHHRWPAHLAHIRNAKAGPCETAELPALTFPTEPARTPTVYRRKTQHMETPEPTDFDKAITDLISEHYPDEIPTGWVLTFAAMNHDGVTGVRVAYSSTQPEHAVIGMLEVGKRIISTYRDDGDLR